MNRIVFLLVSLTVAALTYCTLFYFITPDILIPHIRPALLAFLLGSILGMAEIISRYRDEPLKAMRSSYGFFYILFNGIISFLGFFLILRYPDVFGVANDRLKTAFVAGFGAMVVMRSRIAVIKGPDNKEISIGPDYAVNAFLQLIDTNIDRFRAARRQEIVIANLSNIRSFGSFDEAAKYLFASLLAFQHLDDALKSQLNAIVSEYDKQILPIDIKYLAIGFVFLTIVGEKHYASVLKNAVQLRLPSPEVHPGTNPSAASSK